MRQTSVCPATAGGGRIEGDPGYLLSCDLSVVLTASAPFLVEGDRMLAMLTGPDLLRLHGMIGLNYE